ncbi:hypothetical protein GCM10010411_64270 [Actinomadura fulvescens]|uniref:Uncharacterized protein n=1 Tax=Actinomadura fulvescens TaxID=46160 RepID=A0ABN3Q7X4_9ACTN
MRRTSRGHTKPDDETSEYLPVVLSEYALAIGAGLILLTALLRAHRQAASRHARMASFLAAAVLREQSEAHAGARVRRSELLRAAWKRPDAYRGRCGGRLWDHSCGGRCRSPRGRLVDCGF